MITTRTFKKCSAKCVFIFVSSLVALVWVLVTLYVDLDTLNTTYATDVFEQHSNKVTFNKELFAKPKAPIMTEKPFHDIILTNTSINSGSNKVNTRKKDIPQPEDLLKAGSFHFLPNYKNPCWWNPERLNKTNVPRILCLPYFYLIGAPKAGTTDIQHRLVKHPQISSKVAKGPHWLTRERFSILPTIRTYQTAYFTTATNEIVKKTDAHGKHNIVFGDCSTSTMWDNYALHRFKEFKNVTAPPYTNVDLLYHLNPNVKLIAMLRNPVDRLYSDFLFFDKGKGTPEDKRHDFHNNSVLLIDILKRCFQKYSVRHCLYMRTQRNRVSIGIYSVHLQEWLRVFPRDQLMTIKLEDFSKNTKSYMKKVFSFLNLAPVEDKLLKTLANPNVKANSRKKKDQSVGDMLPETRRIIQDFYQPFNDELVALLGESFNFNT